MEEAKDSKQLNPVIERLASQRAKDKANIAKWGLNVVILLFAILITIIVLTSQGIGINVVAPVAIFGLAVVWLMGWRRGRQLYQRFYSEELSSLQQKPDKKVVDFLAQLTPREIEILNYVAQGYANKLIAFELGVSESTIKTRVTGILSKMDAKGRTEAVVIAIKHGLIAIPEPPQISPQHAKPEAKNKSGSGGI